MPGSEAAQQFTSWNVEKKSGSCEEQLPQDWTAKLSILISSLGLNTAIPLLQSASCHHLNFPPDFCLTLPDREIAIAGWWCFCRGFISFPFFPFLFPSPWRITTLSMCSVWEAKASVVDLRTVWKLRVMLLFLIIMFKETLGYLYVANIWFPIIILGDIFVWGRYFIFEKNK